MKVLSAPMIALMLNYVRFSQTFWLAAKTLLKAGEEMYIKYNVLKQTVKDGRFGYRFIVELFQKRLM